MYFNICYFIHIPQVQSSDLQMLFTNQINFRNCCLSFGSRKTQFVNFAIAKFNCYYHFINYYLRLRSWKFISCTCVLKSTKTIDKKFKCVQTALCTWNMNKIEQVSVSKFIKIQLCVHASSEYHGHSVSTCLSYCPLGDALSLSFSLFSISISIVTIIFIPCTMEWIRRYWCCYCCYCDCEAAESCFAIVKMLAKRASECAS